MKPNDVHRILGATVTDRDWPEDFRHENGRYECGCRFCGQTFYGHKRRVACKVCATSTTDIQGEG